MARCEGRRSSCRILAAVGIWVVEVAEARVVAAVGKEVGNWD
jgi:hypothetical protein